MVVAQGRLHTRRQLQSEVTARSSASNTCKHIIHTNKEQRTAAMSTCARGHLCPERVSCADWLELDVSHNLADL